MVLRGPLLATCDELHASISVQLFALMFLQVLDPALPIQRHDATGTNRMSRPSNFGETD